MFEPPLTWQQLPNGDKLKDMVQQCLDPWLIGMLGDQLLKLGALSAQLDTHKAPIKRHFSGYHCGDTDIRLSPECLPIQSHCIDLTLMSFVLDFEENPHALLREVDRTTIGGGHIMILGFNPLSSLLLGQLIPSKRKQYPWCGRFFGSARLCDWLSLLGYQVVANERLLVHHMLGDYKPESKLQSFADKHFAQAGSVYMILAKKISLPMTPVKKRKGAKKAAWRPVPTAGRTSRVKNPQ
ncbi:class I SAM-dependent methyltransferase [Paraferrimonas sedimenticola]|uniref:Type 11 methyltransferase n=1 Tax=Paraferrimonas sedimenticola TaxID=375674 RepID=A0AA37RW76_9GAMM|nr:class I SAM-dependent methyltransferase [Paraferrimonas sedimenticola]GLP96198.1 type 11 methyltransferase [Paraferrimonas sedimenticola]